MCKTVRNLLQIMNLNQMTSGRKLVGQIKLELSFSRVTCAPKYRKINEYKGVNTILTVKHEGGSVKI